MVDISLAILDRIQSLIIWASISGAVLAMLLTALDMKKKGRTQKDILK